MASLFHYPKARHARKLKPRQFRRYTTYKRWLQAEFSRVCVYCRQPDSGARNLIFHVDHYRPKSLAQFSGLACDYDNLFYACPSCNTRKSIYWPADEAVDPFVVNPCDHEMARHLRFDSVTGKVEARSEFGRHTEMLLQLNDPEFVSYRRQTLLAIQSAENQFRALDAELRALEADAKSGRLSRSEFDGETAQIKEDQLVLRELIESLSGTKPLPPLPKQRNGLAL